LIDIGVATDVNFDGQDDALITAIDGRHGFSILSEKNVLTVITGGYPLVTNVSTSWFGVYWTAGENAWAQVNKSSFSGGDSAFSFTWQGISLPAGATVTKSVIIRFGHSETSHMTLTGTFTLPSGLVYNQGPLSITGTATASIAPTSDAVRLFLVIDRDLTSLTELGGSYSIGSSFTLSLIPANYSLLTGIHEFAIYAIDADGDVSAPQSATLTVVDYLQPTAARSVPVSNLVTPTNSVARSSSAAASSSVTPTSSVTATTTSVVGVTELSNSTSGPELASNSTVVPAVVGAVCGLGAIAGGVALFLYCRKRRKYDTKIGSDSGETQTLGFQTDELMYA
jgi:hypothetical protein